MANIHELSPGQALTFLETSDAQFIDVREPSEYAEVHAEGAVLIPLSELPQRLGEIDRERPAVLICRSGARSMRAAEYLAEQGYSEDHLYNLAGGTLAWVGADLPQVRPAAGAPVPTAQAAAQPLPADLPTEAQVREALKVVKDPEIPVNVVDLGLVYEVEVSPAGQVDVTMTLTSVGCPVQDLIRADAEMAVGRLDGVSGVNVEFVWSPPWSMDMMTEDGKRQMRMFGFNV